MRVAACAVLRLSLSKSKAGAERSLFLPEGASQRRNSRALEPHAHRRPPATRLPPPATRLPPPATPAWSAKDRSDRPCAIADCLARACAGVTRREAHASDVDTTEGTEGVAQALRDALSNDATRIIELFKEWDEDRNGYVSKKEWCRHPCSTPTHRTAAAAQQQAPPLPLPTPPPPPPPQPPPPGARRSRGSGWMCPRRSLVPIG